LIKGKRVQRTWAVFLLVGQQLNLFLGRYLGAGGGVREDDPVEAGERKDVDLSVVGSSLLVLLLCVTCASELSPSVD
jgi:hypothetical protein